MKRVWVLILAAVVVCAFVFVGMKKESPIGWDEFPLSGQSIDFSEVGTIQTIAESLDEQQKEPPQADQQMRAVWFSYLEWNSTFKGVNEADFKQRLETVLNNIQSIGCNTLILHVRAFGDAMYKSSYFPWSASTSGQIGKDPGYDPLSIVVEQAHAKGIAVHAWINPMRTFTEQEFAQLDSSFLIKQWYDGADIRYQYYMKDTTDRLILNPANPDVRQLICNGVTEIVTNYAVDGVHIDDYFYPSGVDALPDNDQRYHDEQAPQTDIAQWRRDSTSSMVAELYSTIKAANPKAVFGVSPQSSLSNNYDKMFIDVAQWLSNPGYLDYIMPQIYFGFQNSSQPFDQTATSWSELIKQPDIKYYVGLASYKIGLESDAHAGEGKTEWLACYNAENNMMQRQIEYLNTISNYSGFCLYSYQSLFQADGSVHVKTQAEINHLIEILK